MATELASLAFLTPLGALVALSAVLPLAALALAGRRERAGRATLGLPAPAAVRRLPVALGLACVVALLALAAAQPAIRSTSAQRVRTDAQAIYVLDVSRSMLAASSPSAPTRLERARRLAISLRRALPELPSGVATLTDRVLPDLLPVDDGATFDATVLRAVAIERPPPAESAVEATQLGALRSLATGNFYGQRARRRLAVVLTDGESRPFDEQALARALAAGPGVRLVLVRLWSSSERVWDGTSPEPGYRPDPSSRQTLDALAADAGGTVVENGGAAAGAIRRALGSGPTELHGTRTQTTTLAPWLALAALLPLVLLLGRGVVPSAALARGRRERYAPPGAVAREGR